MIVPKEWSFNMDLHIQKTSSNPNDDINRAVGKYPSSIFSISVPVLKVNYGWNNIEILAALKVERVTFSKPGYVFVYTPFYAQAWKENLPCYS